MTYPLATDDPNQDLIVSLHSPDRAVRAAAVQQIAAQQRFTPTIIAALEQMAAADDEPALRQAAQDALELPVGRTARSIMSRLTGLGSERTEILRQLYRWLFAGRLTLDQAAALRGRYTYDFAAPALSRKSAQLLLDEVKTWQRDGLISAEQSAVLVAELEQVIQPAVQPKAQTTRAAEEKASSAVQAPAPTPVSVPVRPEAITPAAVAPVSAQAAIPLPPIVPAPRQSIMEVLFSEVSIRIALYLGCFLVAAAALILATLLEVARLPILLSLTAIAGGSALALRKRLPLPSYVLFLLFAALLPIDSRVLADLYHLRGGSSDLFWAATWTVVALALGLGGVLYRSKLMVIVGPFALDLAAAMFAIRIGANDADSKFYLVIAALTLSSLINIAWMTLLKRFQRLPVALTVISISKLALVMVTAFFALILLEVEGQPADLARWAVAIIWLVGTLSFILIDALVQRFVLHPALAAGAATLIPYTLLSALRVNPETARLVIGAAGLLYLTGGTLLVRRPTTTLRGYPIGQYGPWLLISAGVLITWVTALMADTNDTQLFINLCVWAAALVISAASMPNRPFARIPVWTAGLLFALLAYFQFYELPLMDGNTFLPSYSLLIATLLYLVPDLFLKPDLNAARGWRWPARIFGLLLAAVTVLQALDMSNDFWSGDQQASVIMLAVLAMLALAAGLRYQRAWLGYFFSAGLLAALVDLLHWQSTGSLTAPGWFSPSDWMLPIAGLAVAEYAVGYALRQSGRSRDWARVLIISALITGAGALVRLPFESTLGPGPQAAALLAAGGLFLAERLTTRPAWISVLLELVMDTLFAFALVALLGTAGWTETKFVSSLFGASLIVLGFDLAFTRLKPLPPDSEAITSDYNPRWLPRIVGGGLVLLTTASLLGTSGLRPEFTAACLGGLSAFFLLAGLLYPAPRLGALTTGFLALSLLYVLRWQSPAGDWMLPIVGLAVAEYAIGYVLRRNNRAPAWSQVLILSALVTGAGTLLRFAYEPSTGIGPQAAALLLAAALFLNERLRLRHDHWLAVALEITMDGLLTFALAACLGTQNWNETKLTGVLLSASIITLGFDVLFTRFSGQAPSIKSLMEDASPRWLPRILGGVLVAITTFNLLITPTLKPEFAAACLAALGALFLLAGLFYPAPRLGSLLIAFLALSILYVLRWQGQDQWTTPLTALAVIAYALSAVLEQLGAAFVSPGRLRRDWALTLRLSALALAMIVAISAPFENTLASSIPVAAAATLYAVEAFRRRNVWLGFPANGLYLLAYFIVLFQLKVTEPQYFSLGVAILGMLMHFLLVRSGSRIGAFLTGMVSQLALLGTTYIQMYSTQKLSFFLILFFQGLVVLAYGIAIRSRSLVITPLVFIVVGVITVVLSILSGVPTAIVIGCTGVLLLALGILAVVMRERLLQAGNRIGEQMGSWRA